MNGLNQFTKKCSNNLTHPPCSHKTIFCFSPTPIPKNPPGLVIMVSIFLFLSAMACGVFSTIGFFYPVISADMVRANTPNGERSSSVDEGKNNDKNDKNVNNITDEDDD